MPRDYFKLDGYSVELTRLHDEEYAAVRRRSLAIKDDGFFLLSLLYPDSLFPARERKEDDRRLNLAEFRFIMERLYGPSGAWYDDYKGSFAFLFALTVTKGDQTFPYLLNVRDWRGGPEFLLSKVMESEKRKDDILHPPFEGEFSRQGINGFIAYFYGFLQGSFETYEETRGSRYTPFVSRVPSNLILYGVHDGLFFVDEFDSEEEYETAVGERTI